MTGRRAPLVVHLSHSVVPVQPAVRYPRRWFGLTPIRGWVVRDRVPEPVR